MIQNPHDYLLQSGYFASGQLQSEASAPPMTAGAQKNWLLQFTDLMSLLLTFMVMLYAMADPAPEHWLSSQKVGVQDRVEHIAITGGDLAPQTQAAGYKNDHQMASSLAYIEALFRQHQKHSPVLEQTAFIRDQDKIILRLSSDLVFAVNSATLSPDGKKALKVIGRVMAPYANAVEVHGHSDPRPIRGGAFRSNWDLSLIRAETTAKELRLSGFTRQISVVGWGSGQFGVTSEKPGISEALSARTQEQFRKARRVDIILHAHRGDGGAR